MGLPKIQNRASGGRSLDTHEESPDNNRRSSYEEDRHLNVGAPDHLFVERNHHQLDRRRRRAAQPARPRRLTRRPGSTHTEAATRGPRYSASANQGPLVPLLIADRAMGSKPVRVETACRLHARPASPVPGGDAP
jgi:hypothetical protein